MPENESANDAKTEATPAAAVGKKSKLIPIAAAVVVFVIFIVIFSLKYGVFSSSNVSQSTAQADPQKAKADSIAAAKKAADSVAHVEATAYDGLFSDFEEPRNTNEAGDENTVADDSASKVAYFDSQRTDIAQKLTQLQAEEAKLQSLKSDVEALLQRKKDMEDGNITQMAKLYEGMATEELVPILERLTDAQVSVMISKMKKQKASEVLGKMSPERAAKITQYILSMSEN